MSNLKLIYDNAADRATTLVASTTSGTLVAANMQNDRKGTAHRSTGSPVVYDLTWSTAVTIGAVGLPATNLTATATVRVQLYSDTAMTAQVADSGTVMACPGLNLSLWDWNGVLNANAFAYGGASKTAVWFSQNHTNVKGCKITLTDASNPAGYIDCARIVAGPFWQPTYGADYGATMEMPDTSESRRTHAGDNPTERGTRYDRMTLDLRMMPEADRAQLALMIRNVGTSRNFFLSMLPGLGTAAEQDHMIYGKRANSPMSFDRYNSFGNRLEIEGW